MTINVLFPMAGEGSRFNYKFKPFLKISDKMFVEYAFDYFKDYPDIIGKIYFIVTKEQYVDNDVERVLEDSFHCTR